MLPTIERFNNLVNFASRCRALLIEKLNNYNVAPNDAEKQSVYKLIQCIDNIPNGVNPNWTDWQYFCVANSRNDLVPYLNEKVTSRAYCLELMFWRSSNLTEIPPIYADNTYNIQGMFWGCSSLVTAPFMRTTKAGMVDNLFNGCTSLVTIPAFNPQKVVRGLDTAFKGCSSLKNVTFTGDIPMTTSLQYSPLTVASMKSAITHLKNYKGTAYELMYTISFSSSCWEALEASGAAPNGGTWQDYVSDVLGWNT